MTTLPGDYTGSAAPQTAWPLTAPLAATVRSIERDTRLDVIARPMQAVAGWLTASPSRRGVLTGRWYGHAVHPFLTDIPIGSWTSASLLDLFGGPEARPSAELLTAIGVVGAIPTVVTGLAEWSQTAGGTRRIGVVHATANAVAVGLYTASWAARRRGRHGKGAALALSGMTAATVGGFLGGHLISVDKVSSSYALPGSDQEGANQTSGSSSTL
jgi:hypothetical protein